MNASPQIRALVKVVFLLLAMMIGTVFVALTAFHFGPGTMLVALVLVLLAYLVKVFYDSQVAEEKYKDELRRLHETIRGE